jgi:hypothetical protein
MYVEIHSGNTFEEKLSQTNGTTNTHTMMPIPKAIQPNFRTELVRLFVCIVALSGVRCS